MTCRISSPVGFGAKFLGTPQKYSTFYSMLHLHAIYSYLKHGDDANSLCLYIGALHTVYSLSEPVVGV
jgi:hypothetical protein